MNKIIEGFQNYTISSCGIVRNIDLLELKPSRSNSGYKYVDLYSEGNRTRVYIHRLVAKHYIKGVGDFVNHKDCNKLNNKHTNLEWCTRSENTIHAYTHNLITKSKVIDNINEQDLYIMYKAGYKMILIAEKYNIGITSVSKYINSYVKYTSLQEEFKELKRLSRCNGQHN